MAKQFLTSITRVSDLGDVPFETAALPRTRWATGDYVVCEVVGTPGPLYRVELVTGRRTPVLPGQHIVGAFGARAATVECVGDWRDIGEDGRLHQLTGAGLLGKVSSNSPWAGRPMELLYRGHAVRGDKLNIADFITCPTTTFEMPMVLVVGTSMSAGKTLTGRTIVAELKALGFRVAAAKLTGAAGYKDALSFADAGADRVLDYVDAGLVSTVCGRADFEAGLETLLAMIAGADTDVVVGEIGASPREPYNGMAALARLAPHVRVTALCASDPYAALGFCQACNWRPDFVTGPAANNTAVASLTAELTGLQALDLAGEEGRSALRALLERALSRP